MPVLRICHRTLPAYRHIHDGDWIASRIELHYLDLAVPNEVLFNKPFDEVFMKNDIISVDVKKRQFHPDDCIRNSSCHDAYALSKKVDRIGMELFNLFFKEKVNSAYLECGESAVRFLNMATVFGAEKWKDVVPPGEWYIYPSILKGLYKKRSEHPLLVKKFWDYFCLTERDRLNMFLVVPDAEHLEFMMEVANRTRFDFWGMRYGSKLITKRVVHLYVRQWKFKWVEILLMYGFALEKEVLNGRHCLQRYFPYYSFRFDWDKTISNKFLVWFLAYFYAVMPAIVRHPGYIELYQKLHRSLPQPSHPPSIFRKNLQQVICSYSDQHYYARDPNSPESVRHVQSVVEKMVIEYEKCVEGDCHPTDFSPRKLSHLSRHVVREILGGNFRLPTAIDDLNIPTFHKRFLRLEF